MQQFQNSTALIVAAGATLAIAASCTDEPIRSTGADAPGGKSDHIGPDAGAATGPSDGSSSGDDASGCDESPAGSEIGGGSGYAHRFPERVLCSPPGGEAVRTRQALVDAIEAASEGSVVYVAGDAEIDVSPIQELFVGSGVTIASNRGCDGAPGGLLYKDAFNGKTFRIGRNARGVRFTGLRLRGPETEHFLPDDRGGSAIDFATDAIWVLGSDAEIDNNEIFGWTHRGVAVGARNIEPQNVHVHHNDMHHNQMSGLGYGVEVTNGYALIEYNEFDHNRHSIAGYGHATSGYEARYNVVGPNPEDHAFDMHRTGNNESGGDLTAGGEILIHHNTFEFVENKWGEDDFAFAINGVPDIRAVVQDNWFYHPDPPTSDPFRWGDAFRQSQVDAWTKLFSCGNSYGTTQPECGVGAPRAGCPAEPIEYLESCTRPPGE